MSKNIVLIGYRGAGKTSVAKKLSEMIDKPIINVDEEIIKKTGVSISEYVKKNGWKAFRDEESEIIMSLLNIQNSIIDCGGGVVEREINIKNLKHNGIVIFLEAKPPTIIERTKDNKEMPSLTENKSTAEEVEEVLSKRTPLYKKTADYAIKTDNKTTNEVSDEIIKIINKGNNTKICIPITANIVDKALAELKQAEKNTELIELRIDFIKDINEDKIEELLKNKTKKVIVTCRPENEGGHFNGNEKERISLLKKAIELNADYIDIEFKLNKKDIEDIIKNKNKTKVILSHHNLNETPPLEELKKVFEEMNKLNPDLIKIVTFANSINDNFKIFKLLKNKNNLISFCMGLRGVMSRILAPKYGSCITFASLEKNKESAHGQITIDEMKEEYNISLINPNTKVLGVIGEFAENSRSRFMHNKMFKEKKLDFVYIPFKTKKEELGEFMKNFREFGFRGSAVTIPHKEAIMKHVDEIDDTAQKIGASNTLVNENGKLIAYNTDYYGAVKALKEKTKLANKNVLVIGAGGAARAVVYALKKENAKITIINRTEEKAQKLADEFNIEFDKLENMKELINKNDIAINTTSVGMDPNTDESIIKENEFSEGKIIMDIVYKPIRTKLIMFAEKAGCKTITGERMLIYQATGQYNLWTGQDPDFKIMEKALMEKLNKGE